MQKELPRPAVAGTQPRVNPNQGRSRRPESRRFDGTRIGLDNASMKPTVYLETTVVSYLTARPSRDLVRAAQQQITREWWDQRGRYELFVSELVLTEAGVGDQTAAEARLAAIQGLSVLRVTPDADALAEALVSRLVIPSSALRDAVHVAVCAANGLEYLLTWNCRHLANLHQRARIEQVCRESGFVPPIIGTPNELLEEAS